MSEESIDGLTRKLIKKGSIILPIPNILALSALKKLGANDNIDDAERLILTVWILENQNSERLFDFEENRPTKDELARTAMKIDIENIGDYISCLEEIERLFGGKK